MSNNLQIVSKGLYRGEVDRSFPVAVKEYVFVRRKGRKCLMLRFINDSSMVISAIDFQLVQKNSEGVEIASKKISLKGLNCGAGEVFSPNDCFYVKDRCVGFEIRMISVFSGGYEYKSANGESYVKYPLKSNWAYNSSGSAFCNQRSKINGKVKFTAAILIFALVLIALAVIWPFFTKEVCPAIIRLIKLLWQVFTNGVKVFFENFGKIFEK